MSVGYRGIQWNRHKRNYDFALVAAVALCFGAFVIVSAVTRPKIAPEALLIRGTAITGFVLLHVILAIGPLARLDRRFLPLLYNRRHLGVTMFLLALVHAILAILQYHSMGDTHPLVSVFTSYRQDYDPFLRQSANIAHFPFEPLGAAALMILFLMAATSHDFWLKNLGASWWKVLHILVLVAYGLLVLHVAFGVLQSERSPAYVVLLATGALTVYGLHVAAARREAARDDQDGSSPEADGFTRACAVDEVEEGRGNTVVVAGERIAVFRHQGRFHALSNVCRHQGGPIGEGRIVDGCITCPWHGWQYRPEDGCSPPPFEEVVATYAVRVHDHAVYVRVEEKESHE